MSFKLVEAKTGDSKFISCKEFFNPIRSKKDVTIWSISEVKFLINSALFFLLLIKDVLNKYFLNNLLDIYSCTP